MISNQASDRKTMWREIQARNKREVSTERLTADIQGIKDETIDNKNLADLTLKQKEDLQKFVEIAYKNKNLWWTDGDILKGKPKIISLSDYFSWKIDILNEILINFPIIDIDVNDKEIKKVLQFVSEDELMGNDVRPSLDLCEVPLYCFRFKKQENLIDNDNVRFDIKDLKKLNTQELLDNLQSILENLKDGKFDDKYWTKSR